jgi:hypothetical protein
MQDDETVDHDADLGHFQAYAVSASGHKVTAARSGQHGALQHDTSAKHTAVGTERMGCSGGAGLSIVDRCRSPMLPPLTNEQLLRIYPRQAEALKASLASVAQIGVRRRAYRETVEDQNPLHLDKLEAMMRTKLEQYAKGSSKSMLHNKFR